MSVPEPSTFSVPALTLTIPVLLKLPIQPLKAGCRISVCATAAVLFSVPALANTGYAPLSIATGVACVLARLNTPPTSFTKPGDEPDALV